MIQRKLVVLSFLSLCLFLAKETAFAEAIRVGIPGLSTEFAPVWAARDKGLLKKYNLDTEVIYAGWHATGSGDDRRQPRLRGDGRRLSDRCGEGRRSRHGRHTHGQISLLIDRQAGYQTDGGPEGNKTRDQSFWLQQRCRTASFIATIGD